MEIEELAVERPEALARIPVDALAGVDEAKAREIATAGRFDESRVRPGRRRSCSSSGPSSSPRTPRWSRSTRW